MLGYASRVCFNHLPLNGLGQIMNFSKYISKSRTKHLPLTTKRAGKGYKKGYGARNEGRTTSLGRFIADPEKRTQLVVPDLTDFKVCKFNSSRLYCDFFFSSNFFFFLFSSV